MKIALTPTTGVHGQALIEDLGRHVPDGSFRILAPHVSQADLSQASVPVEWPKLASWNRDALAEALSGCQTLIHGSSVHVRNRNQVDGASLPYNSCALSPEAVLQLYDAASAAGVRRFLLIWEDPIAYSPRYFRSSSELVPGAALIPRYSLLHALTMQTVAALVHRRFSATSPAALTIVVAIPLDVRFEPFLYDPLREFLDGGIWKQIGRPQGAESFPSSHISVSSRYEGILWAVRHGFEGIWELALP